MARAADDPVAEHARALADAVAAALPRWVERSVERLVRASGAEMDDGIRASAEAAGRRAAAEIGSSVRTLLDLDIDDQRTTPLALLRSAVRYPTGVLQAAGVPAVVRDPDQERLFPEDVYDLAPATFADLGPEVGDAGLVWGAAKAHTHLRRRAAEGQR